MQGMLEDAEYNGSSKSSKKSIGGNFLGRLCSEGRKMITAKNRRVALFVRGLLTSGSCSEGNFGSSLRSKTKEPSSTFYPTDENELQPVLGHYVYMLDLPF